MFEYKCIYFRKITVSLNIIACMFMSGNTVLIRVLQYLVFRAITRYLSVTKAPHNIEYLRACDLRLSKQSSWTTAPVLLWEDGGVPRAEDTCEWPLGSLVWACKEKREKLPSILHYNINFLSPSNRQFKVNHKTLPPLVMFIRLDIWQLQRTSPRMTRPTWLRESDLQHVRSRWA